MNSKRMYDVSGMNNTQLIAQALLVAKEQLDEQDAIIEELTVENQRMAPKAAFFDAMVEHNMLTTFREAARRIGIKRGTLIQYMLNNDYIYRDDQGQLLPNEDMNEDLFEVMEWTDNAGKRCKLTRMTPKGVETFSLLCR